MGGAQDILECMKNPIRNFYEENGYYVAKGVYSPDEIRELEGDFDRIVKQMQSSGEDVNARWKGGEMDKLKAEKTEILHTHNVQIFSERWHKAFLQEKFLDATSAILGPDIVLHHTKLLQKPFREGGAIPHAPGLDLFPERKGYHDGGRHPCFRGH